MRTWLQRAAWVATGAFLAATIGVGSLATGAFSGSDDGASFHPVQPVRVLDTRPGAGIGLTGPLEATVSRTLPITGMIPTAVGTRTVVPDGATAVALNVTAVGPTSAGFVSVRPGNAVGIPTTSNLNVLPGDAIPNAVTVQVPTSGAAAGSLDLHYFSDPGATSELLIDVVGFFYPSVTGQGPPGPAGPQGPTGEPGPAGPQGEPGPSSASPFLEVVDANGDVIGPVIAGPSPFGNTTVLTQVDDTLVLMNPDGTVRTFQDQPGFTYFFESEDCSGDPAASALVPFMQEWFGYAMPFRPGGPTFTVGESITWDGPSTQFNSRLVRQPTQSDTCESGPPEAGNFVREMVKSADAPPISDRPGPLSIRPRSD